jgi:hypothetical protein
MSTGQRSIDRRAEDTLPLLIHQQSKVFSISVLIPRFGEYFSFISIPGDPSTLKNSIKLLLLSIKLVVKIVKLNYKTKKKIKVLL